MTDKKIEILERALAREKKARKEAEKILESKAFELYQLTGQLKESNNTLESLLAKKDLELKGVFKNIADAYCVMDMYGNVLEMNGATFNLLDCTSKEDNINLTEFVHPEDVSIVYNVFNTLKKHGEFKDLKVRIISYKKIVKHIHISASIIFNSEGKAIAVQGIARDITQENKLKEGIIESESRLKVLIGNLDSGVLLEDENRRIVLTNKKFCKLFSIPVDPDLLIGQDCSGSAEQSMSLFKNPEEFVSKIAAIVENKKEILSEEIIMADGKILERDYIPIFKNEEYKGHLWTYRDVTLQRNYSKNLEAERHKYSSIIANMNLGLTEVNNNNEIVLVNQSFAELTGYSEKELLGMNALDVLIPETDKESVTQLADNTRAGQSQSLEMRIKDKNGKIKSIIASSAPNYDDKGKVVGSIGVILDITEIKNLEKEKEILLENLANSNNELQEYAHIVSHDLKSPLRSIFALVSWIKEDNEGNLNASSLANISLIESTLEKMEQLITDILNYSSVTSESSLGNPVDLNIVVQDLQQILYVPEHIDIKVLSKLPIIVGDKTRLQQLFQNLMSNAIRYIDKPVGKITIDVSEQLTHYQFSIADNGIGIAKEYHDKIFKIFHSLNDRKESTGVGLSIVKKIVDLYKGEIWLESIPGKGTTFFFTLKKENEREA
ncbi:PAS domain S-box-containing protein [Flavobacteriaceae bacterium MAR_2010_72]|nr:PAS domain S-box-containing protein [Flavobacteriaceae bacterium MAR_2010_72]